MTELIYFDSTPANNNEPSPNGAPEGMLPGQVNNVIRENMAAFKKFESDLSGTLGIQGTNTYTVSTGVLYSVYVTGMRFRAKVVNSNTGAATLNVRGLGAKDIVDFDGNALTGAEFTAGRIYQFFFDGTNMVVLDSLTAGQAAATWARSSNPTGIAPADLLGWFGTQSEYDALGNYNNNRLYFVGG